MQSKYYWAMHRQEACHQQYAQQGLLKVVIQTYDLGESPSALVSPL